MEREGLVLIKEPTAAIVVAGFLVVAFILSLLMSNLGEESPQQATVIKLKRKEEQLQEKEEKLKQIEHQLKGIH